MAANARDLTVDILAKDDTKRATTTAAGNFDRLKRKVDDTAKSGDGLGKKLGAGLDALKLPILGVVGALGAFAIQAGKMASDAQQSIGSVQVIFGKSADQIIAKANKAATAYGISADQYRQSADLIGSLLKNQGTAQDQLAGKTDGLIAKAADMAAVFGGSTSDAVDALTSALKGEFDPIEKYGVSLNQSAIDAEALNQAHVKTVQQFNKLTPAQQKAAKSAATLALINKQTADTQGQFAAQSDTTAEKVQILKAKYADFAAKVGTKLLPVFDKVLDAVPKITGWMQRNKPVVIAAAVAVGILAAAILGMAIAEYIAAAPFVLIIAALAALAVGLVWAYNNVGWFRDAVDSVKPYIVDFYKTMFKVWGAIWDDLLKPFFGWLFGTFYPFMFSLWGKIGGKIIDFGKTTVNAVKSAYDFTTSTFSKIGDVVGGAIGKAAGGVKSGINGVINTTNRAIGVVNSFVDKVNKVPGVSFPHLPTIPNFRADQPGVGGFAATSGGGGTFVVQAGDTNVAVALDGAPLRAMVRTEVRSSERRVAWKQRVGAR